jgi:hypothetical protein
LAAQSAISFLFQVCLEFDTVKKFPERNTSDKLQTLKIMKFLQIVWLLLGGSSLLFAQDEIDFKWGQVPESDLVMTVYQPDPEAGAVVLADVGELQFNMLNDDIKFTLQRHRRIKILNRSEFEKADINLPFYSYLRNETISNFKAKVFSPDGAVTNISRKDIREEALDDRWSVIKVTLPNIQEGSVIEYKYTLESKDIFQLEEWYFQEDIPVRWSELIMEIPVWFEYSFLTQGRPLDINEKVTRQTMLTVPRIVNDHINIGTMDGGMQQVETDVNILRLVGKNVPALREEPFVTTMKNHYSQVRFQLNQVKFPGGEPQSILPSWEKVCQNLLEDPNFGGQIDRDRKFKQAWEDVAPQLKGLESDRERANALFDFVQNRMSWNGAGNIYVRQDLDDCYEAGEGSGTEINLLLLALLKKAGLEAYPLLLSTRDHGKMFELYPFLDQFNHMILVLILSETEALFMDATAEELPTGYPAVRSLNGRALLVNPSTPSFIDVRPPEAKSVYYSQLDLKVDGTLEGTMKTSFSGYASGRWRSDLREVGSPQALWQQSLMETFPAVTVTGVTVEGDNNTYEDVKEEVSCRIPGAGQVAGNFIYVPAIPYSGFRENPFSLEERTYPVEIPYPVSEKYIVNIAPPAGYVLDEVPEPTKVIMEGGGGSFSFRGSQRPNGVQVICDMEINQLVYPPESYPVIKGYFDVIAEKMNEQFVFRKAE